jgi:hypothetical protein
VNGPDVVRPASHRFREGGRDRAGAQGVAERLTGAEFRGERHRGEKLNQTKRAGRLTLVRADHEWNGIEPTPAYRFGAEKSSRVSRSTRGARKGPSTTSVSSDSPTREQFRGALSDRYLNSF